MQAKMTGTEVTQFAKFPQSDSDIVQAHVHSMSRLSQGEGVKRTYKVTLDLSVSSEG